MAGSVFGGPIGSVLNLGELIVNSVESSDRGYDRFFRPIADQRRDWEDANVTTSDFIAAYRDDLSILRLGTSFVPEEFGIDYSHRSPENFRQSLDCLKFGVEELGMQNVRLGIRWRNVIDEHGEVDLSFYEPYINYLMDRGVVICINFGYKTMRWPETHPPDEIYQIPEFPGYGETVTIDHPFAPVALKHIEEICTAIKRVYGDSFDQIQVENEPFVPVGENAHKLGECYMSEAIAIANGEFPGAKIVLNTGTNTGLLDSKKFAVELMKTAPHLRGKLVFGYDFYYLKDKKPNELAFVERLPWFIAERIRGLITPLGISPITKTRIEHGDVYKQIKSELGNHGAEVYIAEGQWENWGDEHRPGDDLRCFHFMFLQCMRHLLDMSRNANLNLWGLEKYFKKKGTNNWTWQHEEMGHLIGAINSGV